MKTVRCLQCGAEMKKGDKVDFNIALQLLAVILFFFGVALLFIVPIGTLIGLIIMLSTVRMGYKKPKIWECPNCNYFFERA